MPQVLPHRKAALCLQHVVSQLDAVHTVQQVKAATQLVANADVLTIAWLDNFTQANRWTQEAKTISKTSVDNTQQSGVVPKC